MMNERKTPFMALADYDVAPYGHNDFFDAVQLFCSNGILGLGIGNEDQIYPRFGVPTLHLPVPREGYNRLSSKRSQILVERAMTKDFGSKMI
jgi:hypothetical protein